MRKRTVRPGPGLYDVRGAAAYLGVDQKTIRLWVREGTLPASRPGPRTLRIRQADLEALLERTLVKPAK